MAYEDIFLGTVANDDTGDSPRVAGQKINDNFSQSYGRFNILGAVSQSSGVPTGAIIERGSNANGDYVKFTDGTLICWHVDTTLKTTATPVGSVFFAGSSVFTFPAAFASAPKVLEGLERVSGVGWAYGSITSSSNVTLGMAGSLSSNTGYVKYVAIGSWL